VALLVTATSDRLRVQNPIATNGSLSRTTVRKTTRALEGRLERQRLGARGLVHTLTTATLTVVRGTHVFNRVFPYTRIGYS
jgi:hypothetical protein